jgi:LuxR family maltose regulon positive regulatory protein
MTDDAKLAVDQEPAWSPWRDSALLLLAEAHLLNGDLDQAAALLAESAALGAQLGNTDTVVAGGSELALLLMDRSRWEEAARSLAPAVAAIDEYRMDDYVVSALAFAAAARLALHRGDLDETNRQLTRAMRTRPSCTYVIPWLAVGVRLHLAKVYLALSDAITAHHLMREVDDILLRRPTLGRLTEDVQALQASLISGGPTDATAGPPLSPAELRVLPYLQTHLTLPEIAGRLFVSHNTVRSQVGSIYRKFGVSSRSEAVQHATDVGLLGG